MMATSYSVLMSVYYKESPEFLRTSMESIRIQTAPTNDFVVVCDGPLTSELDAVLREEQEKFESALHIHRLEKSGGLGNALNEGLKICRNELVTRMDSDDISRPDRCEKQLRVFEQNPAIDFTSGTISEFETDPKVPFGVRHLPTTNEEIIKFSKKRNPMNHVAVMFKKNAVESAGGYRETFHLFEDYYLWVRMLRKEYKAQNIPDVLVDVRTPADMYLRRGSRDYAKTMMKFHKWLRSIGWTSEIDFLTGAVPHAAVCVMPNGIRKMIYKGLRKE